jgi:hypothetical protein
MLFNKGLALGGAMLVAAIPGQSATLHAQSVNSKVVTTRTASGGNSVGVANRTVPAAAANSTRRAPRATVNEPTPVSLVDTVVNTVSTAVNTVTAAAGTLVDSAITLVSAPAPTTTVQVSTSATTTSTATQLSTQRSLLPEPTMSSMPTPVGNNLDPELVTGSVAKVFTVSNATELRSALTAAQSLAGAEIRVNPGNYGVLDWRSKRYPNGMVRIVAATATRPVFSAISFASSSGILMSGVQVSGGASPLVNLSGASNIRFTNSHLRGASANLDPWDDSNTAIWVRSASNITLSGNDFQDLRAALYIQNAYDVDVTRNSFTYLREGINVASLGRGSISGNVFHSFSPNYGLREHPDAIQFWTRGETWGSFDITLANNFFAFGGQRAVQGIFIRSEEAESYNRPVYYRNFTITGNVYYGSSLHGISLSSVHGARITNNVAVASPWADQNNSSLRFADGRSSGGLQPNIRAINGSDIVMQRNVSMNVPGGQGVSVSDHISIFNTHTRTGEPWTSVFAARPTADIPPLSAFRTVEPSAVTRNIGMLRTFAVGPTS